MKFALTEIKDTQYDLNICFNYTSPEFPTISRVSTITLWIIYYCLCVE